MKYFYRTRAPISSPCLFSYIWRHLDIGYVQGMCDLLAPLLVILDDGASSPLPLFLQDRYISAVLTTCPLTPAPSLFSPFRGNRFQLFLRVHEANESKLSTRRSHGHSFRQHALSHPGDAESLQQEICWPTHSHSSATFPLCRSWIRNCLN